MRFRKVRLEEPKKFLVPKTTIDVIVDDFKLESYYDKGYKFVCELYDDNVCVHCGSIENDGFWCDDCGLPIGGEFPKDFTKGK